MLVDDDDTASLVHYSRGSPPKDAASSCIHKIFSFGRLRSTVTNGITTLDQNITHILYKDISRELSYKKNET